MTSARRPRHDGWTPERQAIFISILRLSRCVRKAAAAAGMSRNSAYALRRRASGQRFAAAWDLALMPKPLRKDDKDDTLVGSAGKPEGDTSRLCKDDKDDEPDHSPGRPHLRMDLAASSSRRDAFFAALRTTGRPPAGLAAPRRRP
jgi:hypothetical protein